jgi:hypothetical protein
MSILRPEAAPEATVHQSGGGVCGSLSRWERVGSQLCTQWRGAGVSGYVEGGVYWVCCLADCLGRAPNSGACPE